MSSSSSSFTENLFGPKDSSISTSSSRFGSVFGPSSMGLGNDSSHGNYSGSSKKQYFGSSKHSTTDIKTQRSNGQKESNPIYGTETAEPSYLSSSIYYGDQKFYPPTTHNTFSKHTLKRSGGDEDHNGSSASRGNWWQGSLYY